MSTAFICFTAVAACVMMVLIGVVLRRMGKIPVAADSALLNLCVNLLMPCLILDKILYTRVFDDPQNLLLPPLVAFLMAVLGIGIAYSIARLLPRATGLTSPQAARTFAVSIGIFNYGFVPVPIVQTMFDGAEEAAMLAVLFVQNLGVELSIWTVAIFLLGGHERSAWKKMINGPTVAIVAGVLLNAIYRSDIFHNFFVTVLPAFEFVKMAIHYLGNMAIPLAVILVGTTMADLFNLERLRREWRTVTRVACWSILLRSLLLPPLFIALAVWLPCSPEMKQILVIHAAMGSAIFTTVLASHYRSAPEVAFDAVVSNLLVSIITAPIWITIGLACIK